MTKLVFKQWQLGTNQLVAQGVQNNEEA